MEDTNDSYISTSPLMLVTMNATNTTEDGGDRRQEILILVSQILNTASLVIIMIAMGCQVDPKAIKETFRRPVGFVIGMASQFVLMPLISFCMALALRLNTAEALSVLILGCCPGGTLSNIFTYWTDGDIVLSVSMTTVSTTAAIGMMPLNLFIYSRVWTSESAVIPYVNIITTLVSICIPVMFGVILRHFKHKWADYVTKISSVIMVFMIIGSFTLLFLINPTFYLASWGLWVCGVTLPLVGYAIGYLFAYFLRQSNKKCRAIAFETGSQNVALALTLTSLTFAGTDLFIDMYFYPTLYAIFVSADSAVVVVIYRAYVAKFGGDTEGDKEPTIPEDREPKCVLNSAYVVNNDEIVRSADENKTENVNDADGIHRANGQSGTDTLEG